MPMWTSLLSILLEQTTKLLSIRHSIKSDLYVDACYVFGPAMIIFSDALMLILSLPERMHEKEKGVNMRERGGKGGGACCHCSCRFSRFCENMCQQGVAFRSESQNPKMGWEVSCGEMNVGREGIL